MALVPLSTRTAPRGQFGVLADVLFPVDSVSEVRCMPGFETNQTSNQLLSLPIRIRIIFCSMLLIALSSSERAIRQSVIRKFISRTRRNLHGETAGIVGKVSPSVTDRMVRNGWKIGWMEQSPPIHLRGFYCAFRLGAGVIHGSICYSKCGHGRCAKCLEMVRSNRRNSKRDSNRWSLLRWGAYMMRHKATLN